MWVWFFVWFGTGIVAGLILGNYLDQHDVLYSCPRCNRAKFVDNQITRHSREFSALAEKMDTAIGDECQICGMNKSGDNYYCSHHDGR